MVSNQLISSYSNKAVLDINLCAECLKALDMLVYRTAANITATRKCYLGVLVLAKKSAEKIVGSSYLSDKLIIYTEVSNGSTIYPNCMIIYSFNNGSYFFNGTKKHLYITNIRKILYLNRLVTHNGSG